MRINKKSVMIWVAAGLLTTGLAFGSLAADDDCKDANTWSQCIEGLERTHVKVRNDAQAKKKLGEVELAAQQKLLSGVSLGDSATARQDFLSALLAAFGVSGFQDEKGELNVQFNSRKLDFGTLSFSGVLRQPTVFSQLEKKIPEAIRKDRVATLREGLTDFDDLELRAKFLFGGTGKGRALPDYDQLFETLVGEAQENAGVEGNVQARLEFELNFGSQQIGATSPAERSSRLQQAKELAVSQLDSQFNEIDLLDDRSFFDLPKLANKQPQYYFAGSFRERDETAGTDEWSVSFTAEVSTRENIDDLFNYCKTLRPAETNPIDLTCLNDFLAQPRVREGLNRTDGWHFEASYGEIGKYRFALPADSVVLELARVDKLEAKLAFGRGIRYDLDGNEQSRFDFEAKYQDVSGDEILNNRLVATLTFTERLTKDVALAIGAVWANEPEYRGDIDAEVGARAGLRYRVVRPK